MTPYPVGFPNDAAQVVIQAIEGNPQSPAYIGLATWNLEGYFLGMLAQYPPATPAVFTAMASSEFTTELRAAMTSDPRKINWGNLLKTLLGLAQTLGPILGPILGGLGGATGALPGNSVGETGPMISKGFPGS